MDDAPVLGHIESLVQEERALISRERVDAASSELLAADRERLEQISVELDRCWDLLRQRRARRSAGQDPAEATLRDGETVEKYLQ